LLDLDSTSAFADACYFTKFLMRPISLFTVLLFSRITHGNLISIFIGVYW